MKDPRFPKEEKLCNKKDIDLLFSSGRSRKSYPFRFTWRKLEKGEDSDSLKVLIAVPKRSLKKAVDRNLIKRRIREAFRKNKSMLYDVLPEGEELHLAILFFPRTCMRYNNIEDKLVVSLRDLCSKELK